MMICKISVTHGFWENNKSDTHERHLFCEAQIRKEHKKRHLNTTNKAETETGCSFDTKGKLMT